MIQFGEGCFEAQFASIRLHGYEATPFNGYASCGPWEFGGDIKFPSFQTKSYEDCLALCRQNIEAGMDSPSAFLLAAGCEFPPLAPPVNLMAMVDAADMLGRYE